MSYNKQKLFPDLKVLKLGFFLNNKTVIYILKNYPPVVKYVLGILCYIYCTYIMPMLFYFFL